LNDEIYLIRGSHTAKKFGAFSSGPGNKFAQKKALTHDKKKITQSRNVTRGRCKRTWEEEFLEALGPLERGGNQGKTILIENLVVWFVGKGRRTREEWCRRFENRRGTECEQFYHTISATKRKIVWPIRNCDGGSKIEGPAYHAGALIQ